MRTVLDLCRAAGLPVRSVLEAELAALGFLDPLGTAGVKFLYQSMVRRDVYIIAANAAEIVQVSLGLSIKCLDKPACLVEALRFTLVHGASLGWWSARTLAHPIYVHNDPSGTPLFAV